MSYILDALRKSEQDRQREAMPGLTTLHVDTLAEPGHPAMGPVPLLAGAVLIALAVALVWTHPWRSDRSGPPGDVAAIPAPPPQPEPYLAALDPPAAMPPPAPVPQPVPGPRSAARTLPATVPLSKPAHAMLKERIAAPHPSIKSSPNGSPEALPQDAAAAASVKLPAAQAASEPQSKQSDGRQELLAFSELPPTVQQALPKLSISGFVQYPGDSPGDADKRMIGIGERLAQQGDEISPGLKVEQIARDRVVFDYKGYRFWLGMH